MQIKYLTLLYLLSTPPLFTAPTETPLPNAQPTRRFSFLVEGLFWWAQEGGLEFAISDPCYNAKHAHLGDAQFWNPKTTWSTGFRLSGGYVLPHDGWNLTASWTKFQNDPQTTTLENKNTHLIPLFSPLEPAKTNLTVSTATARWKMALNLLDTELGRAFLVSPSLSLHPFMGVRGALTQESYKLFYFNFSHLNQWPNESFLVFKEEIALKNRTWGVGPRTGLSTRWALGKGVSIYSCAALSLLYGNFSVPTTEKPIYTITINDEPYSGTFSSPLHEVYHLTQSVTDLTLGLLWEHYFGTTYRFALNLGYEQHLFVNRNQFWKMARPVKITKTFSHERGDLSFQGITLGLLFDF